MSNPGVIGAIVAGVLIVLFLLIRKRSVRPEGASSSVTAEIPEYDYDAAIASFQKTREDLHRLFFERASGSGRPRGLRWVKCDFGDDTQFAQEQSTGALSALTSVTISFEAIEGGDMEDVEAVSNLRAGTALVRFDDKGWAADGRVIFNHEPADVLERFSDELSLYQPESATVGEENTV